MPSSKNTHIRIDCDDQASPKLAALRNDLIYLLPAMSCTETASCEDGDHTYSWPCDLARTDA